MKKILLTLGLSCVITLNSFADIEYDTYIAKKTTTVTSYSNLLKIDGNILTTLNPDFKKGKIKKNTVIKLPKGWGALLKESYPKLKIDWARFNTDLNSMVNSNDKNAGDGLMKFSEFLNIDLSRLSFSDAKIEGKPVKVYMDDKKMIIKSKTEIPDCKYQRLYEDYSYCLIKKE